MTNPYKAPESDIETEISDPDPRLGWKMFFLFILAIDLLGFYDTYESILDGTVKTVDLVGLFVYPLMVLALFGYAFKKAFFHPLVWKLFFPICLILDTWEIFQIFQDDPEFSRNGIILMLFIATLTPLLLLQYLALYRYGFTHRAPWDK